MFILFTTNFYKPKEYAWKSKTVKTKLFSVPVHVTVNLFVFSWVANVEHTWSLGLLGFFICEMIVLSTSVHQLKKMQTPMHLKFEIPFRPKIKLYWWCSQSSKTHLFWFWHRCQKIEATLFNVEYPKRFSTHTVNSFLKTSP